MKTKSKSKVKSRAKPRIRKSPFRGMLPNGEYCNSEKEYADAWMEMSRYLEGELPGLKLYGIDPGISFHWKGTVIDLPRSFALALVERLKTGKAAPAISPEKVPQALTQSFWGDFKQMIEDPFAASRKPSEQSIRDTAPGTIGSLSWKDRGP